MKTMTTTARLLATKKVTATSGAIQESKHLARKTSSVGGTVHLYVTPPSSRRRSPCSPAGDDRTSISDTTAAGGNFAPHLRVTPPSRRQSTASSVLDPGYFSIPASRRQSSASPLYSDDQEHDLHGIIRLSVPTARRASRGSRHRQPSPSSPSHHRSSSPSPEISCSSPKGQSNPAKLHPDFLQTRRTSSQPSIDLGFYSTPQSRRTSAISPPTSPTTRVLASSPSYYYRPVSPTIEEAQQYGATSRHLPSTTSLVRPADRGFFSTPVSRRASYLSTGTGGDNASKSQPNSRRPSAVSPSRENLFLPHSTPTSRRPSENSPSMLETNQPRTSFRLSPSFFDEQRCVSPQQYFLSPSSAECGGYFSTPITRRPSAISPTSTKPQHYSSPATRRQSFLPPSSLHIPDNKNNLRRPSAPAILCKQDSKKKLLFAESTSPEPKIHIYPSPHRELSLSSIAVQHAYLERVSRRSSVLISPQLSQKVGIQPRQRRQSEPFIEEPPSTFRQRTNSAHTPSTSLAVSRSRATGNTRQRIRSLSSFPEKTRPTRRQSVGSITMPIPDLEFREVNITVPRDRKLGLSIRGGAEYDMGIYISCIERGSVAEDVRLRVGEQIVSVNDISFIDIPHDEAVDILKCHDHMVMVVREQEQHQSTAMMSSSQYVGQWVASCEPSSSSSSPSPMMLTGQQQSQPPQITISPSPSVSFKINRKQRRAETDHGKQSQQLGSSSGTHVAELQIIDAKARTLLTSSAAYNKFIYYREEYERSNMTIDAFIAVIMELLDTPEKYTLLSDIRKIIRSSHLDKFDELVYRREEQVMRNKVTKQIAENLRPASKLGSRSSRISSGPSQHLRRSHEMICSRDPPEGDEGLTGSEDSGVDLTANGGTGAAATGASTSSTQVGVLLPCTSRQAYMASGQHGMEIPRSPKAVRREQIAGPSQRTRASRRTSRADEGGGDQDPPPPSGRQLRDGEESYKAQQDRSSRRLSAVHDTRRSSEKCKSPKKKSGNDAGTVSGREGDFTKRRWDMDRMTSFDFSGGSTIPRQVQRRRSSEEIIFQQQQRNFERSQDSGGATSFSTDSNNGDSGSSHVWRRHHSLQEGSSFIQRPQPRTRFTQLSPEEGKTRKFRVKVPKCKPTLGMVVEGGANTSHHLPRIISILESGCAYECRSLKVGHIIMEVDGVKMEGMLHTEAATFISHTFNRTDKDYVELYVAEKRKTPLEMRRSSHVLQQ